MPSSTPDGWGGVFGPQPRTPPHPHDEAVSALLRKNPALLWDDSVRKLFDQLLATREIPDQRRQAIKRLKELCAAFVEGVLGPGERLSIPARRRGRRPAAESSAQLASDAEEIYDQVLTVLKEPNRRKALQRQERKLGSRGQFKVGPETRDQWIERVVPVLRDVWPVVIDGEFQEERQPELKATSPSDDDLRRWARETIRNRAIALDALAYRFTAWRLSQLEERPVSHDAAKRLIERWRAHHKSLAAGASF